MRANNFIDLTGQTFGRLTVIELAKSSNNKTIWFCKCECGNEKEVHGSNLKRGLTKSCGCLRSENSRKINITHGNVVDRKRSPEYISWTNMRQRCNNPKTTGYNEYGGRGITVCERWQDFESFLEDMGFKPSLKHSIERIDVNKNYEPDNCKWGTAEEQARNKRFNKNSSGYVGVYYQKKKKIWQASIRVNNKNISLGYFKDPELAYEARRNGELKYWGKSS